jgi:hypothetical protein
MKKHFVMVVMKAHSIVAESGCILVCLVEPRWDPNPVSCPERSERRVEGKCHGQQDAGPGSGKESLSIVASL